jgi:hypothetical protein
MRSASLIICVFVHGLAALAVCAQTSGWEARVTAAPNPLPAGKCAALVVEPVDDHGYRRTTLSNGAPLDFRKYTYKLADATHLVVHNDPSMWGNVCADSSTPTTSTIVTVTLPDGLKGTVQLFVLAKGAPPARAVVYRKQAPLKLPTSPAYAPGFVAIAASAANPTNALAADAGGSKSADPTDPSAANTGSATGAGAAGHGGTAGAGGAAGGAAAGPTSGLDPNSTPLNKRAALKIPDATGTHHITPSATITPGTLSLVGTHHMTPTLAITTGTLSLVGTHHITPSVTITTGTLSLTGAPASQTAPVKSPVVTWTKPVSTKQPHTP